MTILVTGGAGFIGSHLCDALLKQGERVVCVDNFDDFYDPMIKENNIRPMVASGKFKLYKADIRDAAAIEKIFEKEKVEKVVHLAARAGVRPSIENPLLYEEVNVRGTLVMLEMARRFKVKQFVFGSSSSVYGINKVPFTEKDTVKPISPYAATKKAGEELCYCYHHLYNTPITCLRFFTVYGPSQRPDLAIHKFAKMINDGKTIEVYGDGTSARDYTYVGDIVAGIIAALKKPFEFEIINLGNSNPVQLHTLILLIEKALGKKAVQKQVSDQPGDVPITYADIGKAKKLLGWEPKTNLEEGIKLFVTWFKLTSR